MSTSPHPRDAAEASDLQLSATLIAAAMVAGGVVPSANYNAETAERAFGLALALRAEGLKHAAATEPQPIIAVAASTLRRLADLAPNDARKDIHQIAEDLEGGAK